MYPPPGVPQQPEPARKPGSLTTARVLMFVGGAIGILFAILVGLSLVALSAVPEAREGLERAMREDGMAGQGMSPDAVMLGLWVALGIMGVYGLVSLVLASFMGRRSPGVYWAVVVFQVVALVVAVGGVATGQLGNIVLVAYTVVVLVLLLLAGSRAYYRRA